MPPPCSFNPFTGNFDFYKVGAGGGPTLQNVTPAGALPGTVFTVPQVGGVDPSGIVLVLNGLVLDQVAGAPAANDEFRLVGTTITTFISVTALDKMKATLFYP